MKKKQFSVCRAVKVSLHWETSLLGELRGNLLDFSWPCGRVESGLTNLHSPNLLFFMTCKLMKNRNYTEIVTNFLKTKLKLILKCRFVCWAPAVESEQAPGSGARSPCRASIALWTSTLRPRHSICLVKDKVVADGQRDCSVLQRKWKVKRKKV